MIRAAILASVLCVAAAAAAPVRGDQAMTSGSLVFPQERHLANLKQLTFSGENAEAYFSFDGKHLIFQSTAGRECDQQYTMKTDGSDLRLVSTGDGRTTCGFFYPDGKHILYASTHLAGRACPTPPSQAEGYVWGVFSSYDIFQANVDGSGLVPLTNTPGYDAEATIAKDGRIVFTSTRDGDLEIYSMNGDGKLVTRLTHLPGPDGGPVFSPDGSKIVFRGHHLSPGDELDEYYSLLKRDAWKPTELEIYVMDRNGANVRQVTHFGHANWAPAWTTDGKRIIFASNMKDPAQRNFDLFLINLDGSGLEQITFNPTFDGFPMFSPDGKKIVFASNRNDQTGTETNIFVGDWIR